MLPRPADGTDPIALRLKRSFDRHFDAPLEAWGSFAARCQRVTFSKHQVIKPRGEAESHGYFILRGSGGVFLWKRSHDVCLDLIYEDEFFGDHLSLITGQATPLETVALEPSEMLRISRADIELLKQSPMGRLLFLIAAEQSFVVKQQQQVDLLLKTAEQRYRELVRRQPRIVQRTAQKHIASYLGITTQSLSRIRRRMVTRR
jgi:CRP/FNR family transcriptional regulator, anaerobic regulatory protein